MDLKIHQSHLFFGGASLSSQGGGYGFGKVETEALLESAYLNGLRVFDTAPIYGFGESEVQLGKYFKLRREEVFFISKGGVHWHPNRRVDMTNEPAIIEKMLLESLERLQSDYIDLYMIHWPDAKVDLRRPLEILRKYQEQGKIHHIGLCNTNSEELNKAFEVCEIEAVQNEFNLFNQSFLDLKQEFKEKNILWMSWGGLDKGILAGSVHPGRKYDSTDARSWAPWWKKQNFEKKYAFVEQLKSLLQSKPEWQQYSLLSAALNYGRQRGLDHQLCGFKTPEQLQTSLKVVNQTLPPELLADLRHLSR